MFSQVKSIGSFGERVARRLETQYKMGKGYLDRSPNAHEMGQAVSARRPSHTEILPGAMRVPAVDGSDSSLTQINKAKLRAGWYHRLPS